MLKKWLYLLAIYKSDSDKNDILPQNITTQLSNSKDTDVCLEFRFDLECSERDSSSIVY